MKNSPTVKAGKANLRLVVYVRQQSKALSDP